MVENRFSQERIFVQKLWSRYEKWSTLVTLKGYKIVLDPKSKFLTNFVKFQIGVKWIFLCEKRKKWGFFEKKSKIFMNIDYIENPSLWIENWCLGDILSPYPFLNQIWPIFPKMDFFDFFGFSNILCYFPLLFWGPKMSKYNFLIITLTLSIFFLWTSNGVSNSVTWYFWTNFYYGSTHFDPPVWLQGGGTPWVFCVHPCPPSLKSIIFGRFFLVRNEGQDSP